MQIKELVQQSGLSTDTVRYYIRVGLIQPIAQQDNGYRIFDKDKVYKLRFIRIAKTLGFTLKEIRQILDHADQGTSPCADVRVMVTNRIKENRHKIEQMLELQNRMESALKQWQKMPDKIPEGHSVCHLIESVAKNSPLNEE